VPGRNAQRREQSGREALLDGVDDAEVSPDVQFGSGDEQGVDR
jgi:hypothetical protein